MPSLCIHYGPDRPLSRRRFLDLAEELAAAIEHGLGAHRDVIQIMPVQLAHPPLGRPVYVEIKARAAHPDRIERVLRAHGARYVGRDRQIDTYFHCPAGRLKLRRGTIENALISPEPVSLTASSVFPLGWIARKDGFLHSAASAGADASPVALSKVKR